ncbi:cupin [Candidatus Bathyarchaeota archaeon]|nr:MAG: cupin [Candidatus Bathyarchaeota archaeon]
MPSSKMEVKHLNSPDEVRKFENGKIDLVKIGGATVGRANFEPGWKWSKHVKPVAKTDTCQAAHFQYHVSGVLHVVMNDGTEKDVGPGEISLIPPGHDAWVVGNEPVVMVDFQGMVDYPKQSSKK